MFDVRFLSHELGLIKPDREVFDHVLAALGLAAERIVFLDDNEANVQQAHAVGMTAVRVRGIEQTCAALMSLGVLSSDQPASVDGRG
jgi:putative hydrolase of the HAD superfamily